MRFFWGLAFTFLIGITVAFAQKTEQTVTGQSLESDDSYKSLAEFSWKLGNKRSIGLVDLMIPIYSQRHHNLFFLDLRFVRDNKSSREYNLGLGYRHVLPSLSLAGDPFVLGGYGFYDYRLSPYKNVFRQGTFGIEALHTWVEGRANVYLPSKRQYTLVQTGAHANTFSGFYYYTAASHLKEGAMPGFDAEIGARIPLPWHEDYQWRVYGGGYRFQRKGYKTVAGPRLRTELLIYDPLEKILPISGARLKLGAEYTYDRVRGKIGFWEIGIRVPLGDFKENKKPDQLDQMFQRTVERDVDIVAAPNRGPDLNEVTMVGADGKPIRFYHVTGSAEAGGNGSVEAPFNSLQSAANAAGNDASNGLSSYPVLYISGDCVGALSSNVNFSSGTASNLEHVTLTSSAVAYTSNGTTIPASTTTKPIISSSSFAGMIYAPSTGHNLSSITISGLEMTTDGDGNVVDIRGTGGASSPTHLTMNDSIVRHTGDDVAVGLTIYDHAYGSITNTTISSSSTDGLFVQSRDTLPEGTVTTCTNCTISTGSAGHNALGAWAISNILLESCNLSGVSNTEGMALTVYGAQVTMNGGSLTNGAYGVYANQGTVNLNNVDIRDVSIALYGEESSQLVMEGGSIANTAYGNQTESGSSISLSGVRIVI